MSVGLESMGAISGMDPFMFETIGRLRGYAYREGRKGRSLAYAWVHFMADRMAEVKKIKEVDCG